MQGMIFVNDFKQQQKSKRLHQGDPLNDYVKQFSELNEIVENSKLEDTSAVLGFAKVLQQTM